MTNMGGSRSLCLNDGNRPQTANHWGHTQGPLADREAAVLHAVAGCGLIIRFTGIDGRRGFDARPVGLSFGM
jgi:hypothetical protein